MLARRTALDRADPHCRDLPRRRLRGWRVLGCLGDTRMTTGRRYNLRRTELYIAILAAIDYMRAYP